MTDVTQPTEDQEEKKASARVAEELSDSAATSSPATTTGLNEISTSEPISAGSSELSAAQGERTSKLSDLIDRLRTTLKERVAKLNADNTKDGSQAGVNLHGTRLHMAANVFDAEAQRFVDFLKKEGLE